MLFFDGLFQLQNLFTLLMLVMLQAVLGFDNLLYISLESKRVEPEKQSMVRMWGVGLAIILRLVLLFVLMATLESLKFTLFEIHWEGVVEMEFTMHALVVLGGGVFIMYTAVKEIFHMLSLDELGHDHEAKPKSSVGKAIMWIVIMNLVFSFDSILSAIALTHYFFVMATAIVISGVLMIWMADHVANFLEKNRMYEVLGLFILLLVGVMLLSDGGHLAHMSFFGHEIHKMATSTFYFVLAVLVVIDIVQSRYQKKLLAERAAASKH
ncbi:MAG: TerC family protein [Aureliella sp.]